MEINCASLLILKRLETSIFEKRNLVIVVETHWLKLLLLQYIFDFVGLLIFELITHFVDLQVVLDINSDKILSLVPVSSERICGQSPIALLSRKISSECLTNVKDEIFSNSEKFELRERELNRREKLIRERELKLDRNSADYYGKRYSKSHVDIERPQWITLDECVSANTSQWDSWSSVSDFKTNVKMLRRYQSMKNRPMMIVISKKNARVLL